MLCNIWGAFPGVILVSKQIFLDFKILPVKTENQIDRTASVKTTINKDKIQNSHREIAWSSPNISVVSTDDRVRHHFGVQQLIVNITLPAHGWIVRFEERRVQNLVRKKSDYVWRLVLEGFFLGLRIQKF